MNKNMNGQQNKSSTRPAVMNTGGIRTSNGVSSTGGSNFARANTSKFAQNTKSYDPSEITRLARNDNEQRQNSYMNGMSSGGNRTGSKVTNKYMSQHKGQKMVVD